MYKNKLVYNKNPLGMCLFHFSANSHFCII